LPAIAGELQEEVPLMAAVRDVPDAMRQNVAMSPRHDAFLFVRGADYEKADAEPLEAPILKECRRFFNSVGRSDPGPAKNEKLRGSG
jgi:hypothetical protein